MQVFDSEVRPCDFDRDMMAIIMCDVPIVMYDGKGHGITVGSFDVLRIRPHSTGPGCSISAENHYSGPSGPSVPLTGAMKIAALAGLMTDPRDADKFVRLVEHWHYCCAVNDGHILDDDSYWRPAV